MNYKKYYKIYPGMVLIKSPGHTIGSQMIYVKLQNGNEFLFVGDIVWNFVNIDRLKNRPLLATLFGGEDRHQLGHLIRWLYDEIYTAKDNNIQILPSHDIQVIDDFVKRGLIGDGLSK